MVSLKRYWPSRQATLHSCCVHATPLAHERRNEVTPAHAKARAGAGAKRDAKALLAFATTLPKELADIVVYPLRE